MVKKCFEKNEKKIRKNKNIGLKMEMTNSKRFMVGRWQSQMKFIQAI